MNKLNKSKLSTFEKRVYEYRLKNYKNSNIAKTLGKNSTQISQTVARIKAKGYSIGKNGKPSETTGSALTPYQDKIYSNRLKHMSNVDIAKKLNKTTEQICAMVSVIKNKGYDIPKFKKRNKVSPVTTNIAPADSSNDSSEWGSVNKDFLYSKSKYSIKALNLHGKISQNIDNMTDYQKSICDAIGSGMTPKEIAAKLGKTTQQIHDMIYKLKNKNAITREKSTNHGGLTEYEHAVYTLRSQNIRNIDIAEKLGKTPKQIYHTVARVKSKGFIIPTLENFGSKQVHDVATVDGDKNKNPFSRDNVVDGKNMLSFREIEVSKLLFIGMSPNEIAIKLSLSPKTVATYKCRIFNKLGIRNLVEFVRLAVKHGLGVPVDVENAAHTVGIDDDFDAMLIAESNKYTIIKGSEIFHTVNIAMLETYTGCAWNIIQEHIDTIGLPIRLNECDIYLSSIYNEYALRAGDNLPTPTVVPNRIIGDFYVEKKSTNEVMEQLTQNDLINLQIDVSVMEAMVELYGYPVTVYDYTVHNKETFDAYVRRESSEEDIETIESSIDEVEKPPALIASKKVSLFTRMFG